jgi:hypothetical protein
MSAHRKRRDRSRVIGVRFEGTFDESVAEKLLVKAKAAGVVTEFDTGRGSVVWFNGSPGREFRELKKAVEALIESPS